MDLSKTFDTIITLFNFDFGIALNLQWNHKYPERNLFFQFTNGQLRCCEQSSAQKFLAQQNQIKKSYGKVSC